MPHWSTATMPSNVAARGRGGSGGTSSSPASSAPPSREETNASSQRSIVPPTDAASSFQWSCLGCGSLNHQAEDEEAATTDDNASALTTTTSRTPLTLFRPAAPCAGCGRRKGGLFLFFDAARYYRTGAGASSPFSLTGVSEGGGVITNPTEDGVASTEEGVASLATSDGRRSVMGDPPGRYECRGRGRRRERGSASGDPPDMDELGEEEEGSPMEEDGGNDDPNERVRVADSTQTGDVVFGKEKKDDDGNEENGVRQEEDYDDEVMENAEWDAMISDLKSTIEQAEEREDPVDLNGASREAAGGGGAAPAAAATDDETEDAETRKVDTVVATAAGTGANSASGGCDSATPPSLPAPLGAMAQQSWSDYVADLDREYPQLGLARKWEASFASARQSISTIAITKSSVEARGEGESPAAIVRARDAVTARASAEKGVNAAVEGGGNGMTPAATAVRNASSTGASAGEGTEKEGLKEASGTAVVATAAALTAAGDAGSGGKEDEWQQQPQLAKDTENAKKKPKKRKRRKEKEKKKTAEEGKNVASSSPGDITIAGVPGKKRDAPFAAPRTAAPTEPSEKDTEGSGSGAITDKGIAVSTKTRGALETKEPKRAKSGESGDGATAAAAREAEAGWNGGTAAGKNGNATPPVAARATAATGHSATAKEGGASSTDAGTAISTTLSSKKKKKKRAKSGAPRDDAPVVGGSNSDTAAAAATPGKKEDTTPNTEAARSESSCTGKAGSSADTADATSTPRGPERKKQKQLPRSAGPSLADVAPASTTRAEAREPSEKKNAPTTAAAVVSPIGGGGAPGPKKRPPAEEASGGAFTPAAAMRERGCCGGNAASSSVTAAKITPRVLAAPQSASAAAAEGGVAVPRTAGRPFQYLPSVVVRRLEDGTGLFGLTVKERKDRPPELLPTLPTTGGAVAAAAKAKAVMALFPPSPYVAVEDGPAVSPTGIVRNGDVVLSVNGTVVRGLEYNDVVALMRATPLMLPLRLAVLRPSVAVVGDGCAKEVADAAGGETEVVTPLLVAAVRMGPRPVAADFDCAAARGKESSPRSATAGESGAKAAEEAKLGPSATTAEEGPVAAATGAVPVIASASASNEPSEKASSVLLATSVAALATTKMTTADSANARRAETSKESVRNETAVSAFTAIPSEVQPVARAANADDYHEETPPEAVAGTGAPQASLPATAASRIERDQRSMMSHYRSLSPIILRRLANGTFGVVLKQVQELPGVPTLPPLPPPYVVVKGGVATTGDGAPLRTGDVVTRVGDVDLTGCTSVAVVSRIRSTPRGTPLLLGVLRRTTTVSAVDADDGDKKAAVAAVSTAARIARLAATATAANEVEDEPAVAASAGATAPPPVTARGASAGPADGAATAASGEAPRGTATPSGVSIVLSAEDASRGKADSTKRTATAADGEKTARKIPAPLCSVLQLSAPQYNANEVEDEPTVAASSAAVAPSPVTARGASAGPADGTPTAAGGEALRGTATPSDFSSVPSAEDGSRGKADAAEVITATADGEKSAKNVVSLCILQRLYGANDSEKDSTVSMRSETPQIATDPRVACHGAERVTATSASKSRMGECENVTEASASDRRPAKKAKFTTAAVAAAADVVAERGDVDRAASEKRRLVVGDKVGDEGATSPTPAGKATSKQQTQTVVAAVVRHEVEPEGASPPASKLSVDADENLSTPTRSHDAPKCSGQTTPKGAVAASEESTSQRPTACPAPGATGETEAAEKTASSFDGIGADDAFTRDAKSIGDEVTAAAVGGGSARNSSRGREEVSAAVTVVRPRHRSETSAGGKKNGASDEQGVVAENSDRVSGASSPTSPLEEGPTPDILSVARDGVTPPETGTEETPPVAVKSGGANSRFVPTGYVLVRGIAVSRCAAGRFGICVQPCTVGDGCWPVTDDRHSAKIIHTGDNACAGGKIEVGDVIAGVNGDDVDGTVEFTAILELMKGTPPTRPLLLDVLRKKEAMEVRPPSRDEGTDTIMAIESVRIPTASVSSHVSDVANSEEASSERPPDSVVCRMATNTLNTEEATVKKEASPPSLKDEHKLESERNYSCDEGDGEATLPSNRHGTSSYESHQADQAVPTNETETDLVDPRSSSSLPSSQSSPSASNALFMLAESAGATAVNTSGSSDRKNFSEGGKNDVTSAVEEPVHPVLDEDQVPSRPSYPVHGFGNVDESVDVASKNGPKLNATELPREAAAACSDTFACEKQDGGEKTVEKNESSNTERSSTEALPPRTPTDETTAEVEERAPLSNETFAQWHAQKKKIWRTERKERRKPALSAVTSLTDLAAAPLGGNLANRGAEEMEAALALVESSINVQSNSKPSNDGNLALLIRVMDDSNDAGVSVEIKDCSSEPAPKRKRRSQSRSKPKSWEERIAMLQAYQTQHGHMNVSPAACEENRSLGYWVSNIRQSYRRLRAGLKPQIALTAERIKALEELGFEWENPKKATPVKGKKGKTDSSTAQKATEAGKEKATDLCDGGKSPPVNNAVGGSQSSIDSAPGISKPEHKRDEDKSEADNDQGESEDDNGPNEASAASDSDAGIEEPVNDSDHASGLTGSSSASDQDKERDLVAIRSGEEFSMDRNMRTLLAYRAKHGHCYVPKGQYASLTAFVTKLRDLHKSSSLDPELVKTLESLVFLYAEPASVAERNEYIWDNRLNVLKAYMNRFGSSAVPKDWTENPWLFRWVGTQRDNLRRNNRGKKSPLTPTRVSRLNALGFDWGTPSTNASGGNTAQKEPSSNLTELASQMSSSTGLQSPCSDCEGNDTARKETSPTSKAGLNERRDTGLQSPGSDCGGNDTARTETSPTSKAALNERRDTGLQSLGSDFEGNDTARKETSPTSKAALNKRRDKVATPVTGDSKAEPSALAERVKLRSKRARKDLDGGREESDEMKTWEGRLEALADYKRRAGNTRVPHGPGLGYWVSRQRKDYKKYLLKEKSTLTSEKIAVLDSLGFEWSLINK